MSVKRDTVLNLFGNGIPLIFAAFTIPYLLEKLENEKFGILTLIWALVGYFGLFDLGVGRAMTYEVSRSLGTGDNASISRSIKAGLILTMLTGLLGGAAVLLLAFSGINLFKISPGHQHEAKLAFAIVSLAIVPTTITSGLRGALEGFGRFNESNITRVALGTLIFFLPALSVALGNKGLEPIAWYLVGARFGILTYALFQLREHLVTKNSICYADIKPLLSYGGWVTISGIVSPLMVYGDRFFISMNLGAAALPTYAIVQEGMGRLLVVPTALTGALMPRLAQTEDLDSLKSIYWLYLKKIAWVMLGICAITDILAYPILKYLISPSFANQAILIVIILCFGVWTNSLAQLPLTLLHARGKPKITSILHIIELVLYCGIIIVLSKWFGIIGAALGWTIRVIIDFIMLHWMVIAHFKVPERGGSR